MNGHGRRIVAAGCAVVLLATTGCTGGDEDVSATPTGEPSPTATVSAEADAPYAATLALLERDLPDHIVHLELANAGSRPDQYAVVVQPPDVARVQPRMTEELQPGQRELVQLAVAPDGDPVTVTVRVRSRGASDELAALELTLR